MQIDSPLWLSKVWLNAQWRKLSPQPLSATLPEWLSHSPTATLQSGPATLAEWLSGWVAGSAALAEWQSGWVAGPATLGQWLSGWVAGPATLAEWLSGWVAGSAALAEWLSGWVAGSAALAEWLSGWVAGPATLLEWLSGWVARMDNKLPSLVADYCSCMEEFFRYIRNLSPVKKSLHTLHLNLYSLLARFRDNVSYLYVVFQHAMNQTTFELYHFLVNSFGQCK